jgi:hypothetical protein
MEPQETQEQPAVAPSATRTTWLGLVFDALPFMFAACVIVVVILALLGPSFGSVYSNILVNL